MFHFLAPSDRYRNRLECYPPSRPSLGGARAHGPRNQGSRDPRSVKNIPAAG